MRLDGLSSSGVAVVVVFVVFELALAAGVIYAAGHFINHSW